MAGLDHEDLKEMMDQKEKKGMKVKSDHLVHPEDLVVTNQLLL